MARVHTLARRTDAPAMLVQLTDCHLFGEPDTVMLLSLIHISVHLGSQ